MEIQMTQRLSERLSDLQKKLLWTLFFIGVYRMGIYVPTPGVNAKALEQYFQDTNTIFGLFNAFVGGALQNFSVFALGVMPYISSSIIFSLLVVAFPYLEALQKEGEVGRKKINQYTRYGTIVLTVIQGYGIAVFLESNPGGIAVVDQPGFMFRLTTVVTLSAGTAFLMWLGERITERGIGNGMSLIIYAGIVDRFPSAVYSLWRGYKTGDMRSPDLILMGLFMLVVVGAIIYCERAQRRIPIHHAKRVVGRKLAMAQRQFLPLKLNMSGVIPPIFASSLLMFPQTLSQFLGQRFPVIADVANWFHSGSWGYNTLYVLGIVFFCYFYTAIQFNPVEVADNIKRSGGFIPGIRPGKNTAEYIDRIITRITAFGALYISVICVLPIAFVQKMQIFFGGTGLLIVVGVAMDTIAQIQTHLLTRQYEGLLAGVGGGKAMRRFRGRFG